MRHINRLGTVRVNRLHQIHNARVLATFAGYEAAATYLRCLGWSLEASLWILCRKESRDASHLQ